MNYLLPIFYFILFGLIIRFHPFFAGVFRNKWVPVGLFLIKAIGGIAVYWVYTHIYTDRSSSDTFRYFDDALIIYDSLNHSFWDYFRMVSGFKDDSPDLAANYYSVMSNWDKAFNYGLFNDNRTMIRFNALVMPFSFGNYLVHIAFMVFVSFTGIWLLLLTFIKKTENIFLLIVAIFLLPSVVFWTSGVLKEGLLIFALGLTVHSFFRLTENFTIAWLFTFLLGSLLLLYTKNYVLFSLIPGAIAYLIAFKKNSSGPFRVYVLVLTACFMSTIALHYLVPEKSPYKIVSEKQRDFINLAKGGVILVNIHSKDTVYISPEYSHQLIRKNDTVFVEPDTPVKTWQNNREGTETRVNSDESFQLFLSLVPAGSRIELRHLTSVSDFITSIPTALTNTLLRPFPWEIRSVLDFAAMLENIILILFTLLMVFNFTKPTISILNKFWFCVTFAFVLALLVGWATPVLGAIVRYKTPLLPLFCTAMVLLMRPVSSRPLNKLNSLFLTSYKNKE